MKRTWKLSDSFPLAPIEITQLGPNMTVFCHSQVSPWPSELQTTRNLTQTAAGTCSPSPAGCLTAQISDGPSQIVVLRKQTFRVARSHEMHFRTSSYNSFNGYAWSFNLLSKLVDSLIRVLIGVRVNVGPYSRQLNCKHKSRALTAHSVTEAGQYILLSLALCFAGKHCSWEP